MSMTWRVMGLAVTGCHVMGCHFTRDARVQMRVDDVAGNGHGRFCSPRHRMISRHVGSKCLSMLRQAIFGAALAIGHSQGAAAAIVAAGPSSYRGPAMSSFHTYLNLRFLI